MRRLLFWLCLLVAFAAAPARAAICPSPPYNLTNGTTADAGQVMSNFNSLVTCVNTNAAATGANTSITSLSGLLSPPSGAGSLFFYGSAVAGTANAQTITSTYPGGYSLSNAVSGAGNCIWFQPTVTNTGATTLNVNSTGAINVQKPSVAGPVALSGGELTTSSPALACYNGTIHLLLNPANTVENPPPYVNLAAATTTSLSSTNCSTYKCQITGTNVTITSFGNSATIGQVFYLRFFNQNTVQHGANITTPGNVDYSTNAGDTMFLVYNGASSWTVLGYQAAPVPITAVPASTKNLKIIVTSNTALTVSADYAIVPDNDYSNNVWCPSFSQAISTGGTGAGGTDSGSFASGWWYVYIIGNGSTCSAVLSANSTAPSFTNLSGYTYYFRVGAVSANSTPNLFRTLQLGSRAQYIIGTLPTGMPLVASGNNGNALTAAGVTGGGYAPPTATVVYLALGASGSGSNHHTAAPNGSYGAYNSSSNPPLCEYTVTTAGNTLCSMVLESTNVYYASDDTSGYLMLSGWTDSVAAQ